MRICNACVFVAKCTREVRHVHVIRTSSEPVETSLHMFYAVFYSGRERELFCSLSHKCGCVMRVRHVYAN